MVVSAATGTGRGDGDGDGGGGGASADREKGASDKKGRTQRIMEAMPSSKQATGAGGSSTYQVNGPLPCVRACVKQDGTALALWRHVEVFWLACPPGGKVALCRAAGFASHVFFHAVCFFILLYRIVSV